MKKSNFFGLNMIRFPLSIAIVIYHYPIVTGVIPEVNSAILSFIYSYGLYCVEIFFAISGFVIYWSHAHKLRSPGGGEDFISFILGRIVRIYPLMILTTVCAAICQWMTLLLAPNGHLASMKWAMARWHSTLVGFVFSITGLQSGWFSSHDYAAVIGASWYLAILMICYVLFSFIIRSCKEIKLKENIFFFLLMMLGVHLYIYGDLKFPLMYPSCGRGYLNFFAGVFIAQIVEIIDTPQKRRTALICSGGSIALFSFLSWLQHGDSNSLGHVGIATSIVLIPSLLLLLTCSKLIFKISNNRFVLYLGNISFGIYLWHLPIVMWFFFICDLLNLEPALENPFYLLGLIFFSIVISVITYEVYEKPITAWGKIKIKAINNKSKVRVRN